MSSCHHGSSDFTIEFLRRVRPYATVISSGEVQDYDHPLPDAMGTAGRYTRGSHPLLFSTELARTQFSDGTIQHGHINARTNGSVLVMAQRKEREGKDPWHAYKVPHSGE